MVYPYSNRYTYDRHGQAYGQYTQGFKVMPYDEGVLEGFIDMTKPSNIPILLLIAIVVMFILYFRML